MRLQEALDHFADFKCKDPRDRLYGLLGIMEGMSIEPDYGESRFSLAARLLPYIDWADDITIRRILRAFDYDYTDTELLRTTLQQERYVHCAPTALSSRTKVEMLGGGSLWAGLIAKSAFTAQGVLRGLFLNHIRVPSSGARGTTHDELYTLTQTSIRGWVVGLVNSTSSTRIQWIYHNDRTVGAATSEARDGDIVLRYARELCLIARPSDHNCGGPGAGKLGPRST